MMHKDYRLKKKYFAGIFILTLICAILAGCGEKEKTQISQSAGTITVSEAQNAATGRIEITKETETERPAAPETESETESETKAASKKIVTTEGGVNIRKGPSTETELIGGLLPGDKAIYIGDADGWVNIEWNGVTGYVFAEYVTITDAEQ